MSDSCKTTSKNTRTKQFLGKFTRTISGWPYRFLIGRSEALLSRMSIDDSSSCNRQHSNDLHGELGRKPVNYTTRIFLSFIIEDKF